MSGDDTWADAPIAERAPVGARETADANRRWWDAEAEDYLAEHGAFLGDVELVWGPEGWTEAELGLLGDRSALSGATVLEIGGGAAQGGRWVAAQGARVVSTDLSGGMLAAARTVSRRSGVDVELAQCDACVLPFAEAAFDIVLTAYGAIPFVADSARLLTEVARVLRPGGRAVLSTTHPIRWAFPDVPGEAGLTATTSYFDRTPYVEREPDGSVRYTEHHRTIGDRVRDAVAAGLRVVDLVEPEWPARNDQTWGGWSPLSGRLLPGTLVLVLERS